MKPAPSPNTHDKNKDPPVLLIDRFPGRVPHTAAIIQLNATVSHLVDDQKDPLQNDALGGTKDQSGALLW